MQLLIVLGYLDPGTGSMVVQAVVGSLLGALLVIRLYWRKIIAFLTVRKPPAGTDDVSARDPDHDVQQHR